MDAITPKFTPRRLWLSPLLSVALAVTSFIAGMGIALMPPPHAHAMETTRVVGNMLVAASAANATGTAYGAAYMPACRESVIYVKWSAGVNAGAVTIESSDDSAYSGTWAPLTTVTQTGASREDIVQITGIHINLRSRISTLVTGGTVSTILGCN